DDRALAGAARLPAGHTRPGPRAAGVRGRRAAARSLAAALGRRDRVLDPPRHRGQALAQLDRAVEQLEVDVRRGDPEREPVEVVVAGLVHARAVRLLAQL